MSQPYSQTRALWAITRSSFKAIFAYPSAIVFSILFPIIFVLIFGAFGSGGGPSYRVAITTDTDTASAFFQAIKSNRSIRIVSFPDSVALNKDLIKGRLTAVLSVRSVRDSGGQTKYIVGTRTTSASDNSFGGLWQMLDYTKMKFETPANGGNLVTMLPRKYEEVRKYRQIDFVLPGQLGFSILFSTLFGVAFTFYGLREQLVLKRFYATPVSKLNILTGVGVSRLFFQLLSVMVLLLFGHFALNFTLQNGAITFFEIIAMTIVMLFLLMGVGLIFSSIVKTDSSIPLLINLYGFPQMMLSGTFFPIEVFPKWLQEICNVLPLTQYNDAIRKISFEGQHITDCGKQLGILGIWMIITYVILVKVLKWE